MKLRLALLAAALWWGSLTMLGFLVVPALFANLPTPALAGQTAAKLFSLQTGVSVLCALAVILLSKPPARPRWGSGEAQDPLAEQDLPKNQPSAPVFYESSAINFAICFSITGLLMALLIELAVAPRILARENLAVWHGLGTAMFAAQWAVALGALWSLSKPAESNPSSVSSSQS